LPDYLARAANANAAARPACYRGYADTLPPDARLKTHGTLAKWNAERGFGFISPADGSADVFVHITAFPRDGVPPRVGELLSFEKQEAADGKTKAVMVVRPGTHSRSTRRHRASERHSRVPSIVVATMLLCVACVTAYSRYHRYAAPGAANSPAVIPFAPRRPPPAMTTPSATDARTSGPRAQFKCDGRKYCSQMTSCAEAKFFLQNCPDTHMDGNNDGEPCESQWCN